MAADSTYTQTHRRLVETGQWDKIYAALIERLNELGWIDDLKHTAKERAKDTQFRDLLAALEDHARSTVPPVVKQEIMNTIRAFLEEQYD
ncbi:enhancer of yellow 2 transcription factor [Pyrrhoderma noxium]|uniref:Transcription and mRNA export factor SUS1 n=1 Tax=Pyrrhoderma noxium TaxID=2282107 RepID=A0A286U603_9AGAM|nr:enhancer of yellow 2 transcription factor [Pyrrhoderma noxium]